MEGKLQFRPALSERRRRALWLAVPPLLALLAAWPSASGALDRLEWVTLDARFRARGPLATDPRILLVEVDESSRRELAAEGRRFHLRDHVGDAIDNLADAGTIAIGLDIVFSGLEDSGADARLAEAIGGTTVVLAAAYTDGRKIRAADLFLASGPDEGLISVDPDRDGVLRRIPPAPYIDVPHPDGTFRRIPHFPFVLAYYLLSDPYWDSTAEAPPTDFQSDGTSLIVGRSVAHGSLVSFAAGPEGFRTLSLADVVRGEFDADAVDGSVAIIGPKRSIEDQFPMPFSDELVPGMFYHANVLDQILQGRRLDPWPSTPGGAAWLAVLAGALGGWYFWNPRAWWSGALGWIWLGLYYAGGAAVLAGGWTLAAFRAFDAGVVLPLVAPLVTIAVAFTTGLGAQAAIAIANARRLAERNRYVEVLFGRSVSPVMLDAIKADPERIASIEVRDVSVLFCDIRGFTAASSISSPEQVAAMLNEYFEAISSAVFEQEGFIDKFVGDELMAVFNAPLDQEDHPLRAAEAALRIKSALAELNRKRTARGEDPLQSGVGLHCGRAAAGYIGSGRRANYTVVGDTVNIAARIESKTSRGEILLSDEMRRRLPGSMGIRSWGSVELKGSPRPWELFELPIPGGADPSLA